LQLPANNLVVRTLDSGEASFAKKLAENERSNLLHPL
jgi:hypothetical protein